MSAPDDFIRIVGKDDGLIRIERSEITTFYETKNVEISLYNMRTLHEHFGQILISGNSDCLNVIKELDRIVAESDYYLTNSQRNAIINFKPTYNASLSNTTSLGLAGNTHYGARTIDLSEGRLDSWHSEKLVTVRIDYYNGLNEYLAALHERGYEDLLREYSFDMIDELILSENNLNSFDHNSFRLLENLVVLNLSNNNIRRIDGNWFENFQKLQFLDLSFNLIKQLEVDSFQSLASLEVLDLSFNRLKKIHEDAFIWNEYLEELDLSNNPISSTEKLNGLQRIRDIQKMSSILDVDWREHRLRQTEIMFHKSSNESLFLFLIKKNIPLRRTITDMAGEKLMQNIANLGYRAATPARRPKDFIEQFESLMSDYQNRGSAPRMHDFGGFARVDLARLVFSDEPRKTRRGQLYAGFVDFINYLYEPANMRNPPNHHQTKRICFGDNLTFTITFCEVSNLISTDLKV